MAVNRVPVLKRCRSLFHKHIESLLDGKQQLLDVLVGFHGFLALALQSAGTRICKGPLGEEIELFEEM